MVEAVEGAILGTVIEVASDPRRENRDAAGVEPLEIMLEDESETESYTCTGRGSNDVGRRKSGWDPPFCIRS